MPAVYRNLFAMGTRFDMVIPGIEEETGDYIFSLISKEIRRLEELLSNYNEASALSRLNKDAYHSTVYLEDELFEILCSLQRMHTSSLGFFDAGIGAVLRSSTGTSRPGKLKLNASPGMNDVIIKPEDKSVHFANEKTAIDSGGFGKGFALERVKKILFSHNITQAFISFGESSVLVIGDHPFGEGWKISIPDIYSSRSVYVFQLRDTSLSVSGNTPANTDKYPQGHIVNPFTGNKNPEPGIVCVSGPSAFECEILSTALFIAGESNQKKILGNFPGYKAVCITYPNKDRTPVITEIESD